MLTFHVLGNRNGARESPATDGGAVSTILGLRLDRAFLATAFTGSRCAIWRVGALLMLVMLLLLL